MNRKILPPRRNHITQKARIAGVRTLYLSVDSAEPRELFVRVKERNISPEVVGLYDLAAKLVSLALQYNVPLAKIGETMLGTRFEPSGPVEGHPRIKFCNSPTDYCGRHILVEYCGREDLAHVKKEA